MYKRPMVTLNHDPALENVYGGHHDLVERYEISIYQMAMYL